MKRILIYGEKEEIEMFHRIHDAYMGDQAIINAFTLKGLDKFMYAELIAFEKDSVLRVIESNLIVALFDENNHVKFFNDDMPESDEFDLEQALFAIGLEKQFVFATAEATLLVDIDDFSDTSNIIEVSNDGEVNSELFDASVSLLSAVALSEKIFGERIHADEVLYVKTSDTLDKLLQSKESAMGIEKE